VVVVVMGVVVRLVGDANVGEVFDFTLDLRLSWAARRDAV
jgi:hypothetical protein